MKALFVHYGEDWMAGSEIALLELLRRLPAHGVEPTLWCNAETMRTAGAALGLPTRRHDLTHYFDYSSPPFSPAAYAGMVRMGAELIAQSGADVVHCNSAAPVQWMRPACWRAGVPMLVNLHSPYLRRSRYVLGLHAADRVVAVAEAVARPLIADGMDPARVSVVPNGFDETAVLRGRAEGLRRELGVPPDAPVAGIAGSLIRRKGHDLLFEAMRLPQVQARSLHLLVIGDGPERDAYERLALGLPVRFLGRRDDLGAVLRDNVDFLVAPSRQEAFGRVIIEAALAGLPAIGARVDGIPEAIVEGETGVLVTPESPAELAQAICGFIDDAARRRAMGEAARRRARAEFSIASCAERMAEEYRLTIADHAARRLRRAAPYLNLARVWRATAP